MNAHRKGAVAAREPATPEITADVWSILRGGTVSDNQCQIAHPKRVPRKKQPAAACTSHAFSQTRLNSDTREKPLDLKAQALGGSEHMDG
jgi:hypothetical protein